MSELYARLYQTFDNITPLRTDCGKLCRQACCQNTDADLGMYLFPGEEMILQSADFLRIEPTELFYLPKKPVFFASCQGQCPRSNRPLACRIFPLTPYLTAKDLLVVKYDPRAASLCPLAQNYRRSDLSPHFVKAVRHVGQQLIDNTETKPFLKWLSALLDEETESIAPFLK